MKKTMPKLGDVEAALKKDPAIDPPVGDYEAALESFRDDSHDRWCDLDFDWDDCVSEDGEIDDNE